MPITLIVTLVLATACARQDGPDGKEGYCYAATQCADPWAGQSGSLEERVTQHLADQGIAVLAFSTTTSDTLIAVCQACTCSSGTRIEVEVASADAAALLALDNYPAGGWYACED